MVIVITGPIASGKSTVARELVRELERAHGRVAVIDLDLVHEMVCADRPKSDNATWALARHTAATLAITFLEEGVDVVVAEGSFNTPADREGFARHLGPTIRPVYVTLHVTFEEALRRAQTDPTRGLSRDPAFLGSYFAASAKVLATVPATDLVIDTERVPATAAAVEIASLIRRETAR